ncbi:MAG: hypothetical protein N2422_11440 [Rhodobacteraceae bacterium]|nr:hypothetical protein [Paracoccaceae bacterium]
MIGFLRLAVLGFVALTVLYLLVSLYARSVERERLEKDWDGDPANAGAPDAARQRFIAEGMAAYRHSLRRRLVLLVYAVPLLSIAIVYYLVNS